ncbi:FxLYD domain-containing protein [Oceanithermus sp.]
MLALGTLVVLLGLIGILASPLMWVLGSRQRAKLALRNGFIALFAGIVIAAIGTGGDRATTTPATSPATAPANEGTTNTAPAAQEEPERKPDLEILDVSSEADQYTRYVVGKIRNNTGRKLNFVQVEISLYDDEGNVVGTTFDNVANLEPGQVWKFKAIILEDSATRFKVSDISWF